MNPVIIQKMGMAAFAAFIIGLIILVPKEIQAPAQEIVISPIEVQATPTSTEIIVEATSTPQKTTESSPVVSAAPEIQDAPKGVPHISNPYSFEPVSTEELNTRTRAALVNILCAPQNGSFNPISGSGVIIDPRGVIITNAHVAQYMLVQDSIGYTCTIRTGSPARNTYKAVVMYMPKPWVDEHAKDILNTKATGTGEHDFALLLITTGATGVPLESKEFSYLPYDVREGVVAKGDPVLVAGYPAGFLGGIEATKDLHPLTTTTNLKELLTFTADHIDAFSLGGIILAQGGSSGGAVVNYWGQLVGVVVTSSSGATTAERDLRGLSISHVERTLLLLKNTGLQAFLSGDLLAKAQSFATQDAPIYKAQFLETLKSR